MIAKLETLSFHIITIFLITTGITACAPTASQGPHDVPFESIFPDTVFDNSLHLIAFRSDGALTSTAPTDDVMVSVINNSQQQIQISPVSSHKIFIYDDVEGKWIEIIEKANYVKPENIILYPETHLEKDQYKEWEDFVIPDLSRYVRPVTIRIVYFGETINNNGQNDQKLGTYMDITFE